MVKTIAIFVSTKCKVNEKSVINVFELIDSNDYSACIEIIQKKNEENLHLEKWNW